MIKIVYCCDMCSKELDEKVIQGIDRGNKLDAILDLPHLYCPECQKKLDAQIPKMQEMIKSICEQYTYMPFSHPSCLKCSSNPANGGNGICWCTLATPRIT